MTDDPTDPQRRKPKFEGAGDSPSYRDRKPGGFDRKPPRFQDRPPRRDGDRPPFRPGGGGGYKGKPRFDRDDRPRYEDRPPRKDFGDRPRYEDRGPRKDFNDRPPRFQRDDERGGGDARPPRFQDRPPRREFDDRPPRRDGDRPPFRPGGGGGFHKGGFKPKPRFDREDRPRFEDRGPRKDFNDRPPRRDFDDRGGDTRPPRFQDGPPRRDFEDRRPPFREGFKPKPRFDRDQDRPRFEDRGPRKDFNDRPPRRDFDDRRPPRFQRDDDRGGDRRPSRFQDRPRRDFDEQRPPFQEGFKPKPRFDRDQDRPPRRDFEGRPPRFQRDDDERGSGGGDRRPSRFQDRPKPGGFDRGPKSFSPGPAKATQHRAPSHFPFARDARQAAAVVLHAVFSGRCDNVDDALRDASRQAALDERDMRFARALTYAVVRNALWLDEQFKQFFHDGMERLRMESLIVLRMAAAQKFLMDRVPDHAIVDETAQVAREQFLVPETAVRFVHAIARRIVELPAATGEGTRNQPVTEPLVGVEILDEIANRTSCPRWIVELLDMRLGEARRDVLPKVINDEAGVTLRVNRLRTTREALAAALAEAGVETRPGSMSVDALHLANASDLPTALAHATFREGHFYIQDEASQLVSVLAAPQPGHTVLDLCAAPGGKVTHLAELAGGKASILATDLSFARCRPLFENLERLGTPGVTLVPWESVVSVEAVPDGGSPSDEDAEDARAQQDASHEDDADDLEDLEDLFDESDSDDDDEEDDEDEESEEDFLEYNTDDDPAELMEAQRSPEESTVAQEQAEVSEGGPVVTEAEEPSTAARRRDEPLVLAAKPFRKVGPWFQKEVPAAGRAEAFDLVVLDAPCSAIGTLRRHPESRWRLRRDDLPRLARTQGRLLDLAAQFVRPGGRLVYSTCTITDQENVRVVSAFLGRNPDFRMADAVADLAPAVRRLRGTDGVYRTWPSQIELDGFECCVLERRAGPKPGAGIDING